MEKVLSFIGSGSLLTKAVSFSLKNGFLVENVFCPFNDSAIPALRKSEIPFVEVTSNNLASYLKKYYCHDAKTGIVFSINNRFLIPDCCIKEMLVPVLNIHNGLVQKYRGVAEICVLAAVCRDDKEYGATVHQILPGQGVDMGRVLFQEKFEIVKNDFSWLMSKSLHNCHLTFEKCLLEIFKNGFKSIEPLEVGFSDYIFSYSSLKKYDMFSELNSGSVSLGIYSSVFKKINSYIEGEL